MTQPVSQKPSVQEPHPLVRIATLEAKVAQLEQRLTRLESLQPQPKADSIEPNPKIVPQNNNLFEIVKIDSKIIESNDSWSKFAWKLDLKSFADKPIKFNVSIEFLDNDGFIVDDTFEPNLLLPAQTERSYTGYTLVNDSIVRNVASIQAKVNLL